MVNDILEALNNCPTINSCRLLANNYLEVKLPTLKEVGTDPVGDMFRLLAGEAYLISHSGTTYYWTFI